MSEVLRELVVALSLDSDNFSRNIRTINQQIKEAESAFKLAGAGIDKFESSVQGTESKLSMLGNVLKEQNRAVEQYSRALVTANQKLTDSHERQEKMKAAFVDAKTEYARLKIEVGNAAKEYRRLASTLGENDAATVAAKANLDALKQEFIDARQKVKLLDGQIKSNSKTLQNNADAISKAKADLNNAKAAVKETEAEIKKLTKELYRMESVWTKAGEGLTKFSKKAKTVSKALTKTGKAMTAAITTPLAALATAAIKASIDYESAFTSVRKTVDATEDEFAALSLGIKEMSTQVAASASDIAEVVSIAGQMGIANENLLDFSRTMIDLGNSTDIVAEQAAMTLSRFINIMGMNQNEISNLGSSLVELGNNYATTESAIMEMSLRLAAAGKQVGLSESQILGFATALSSVGIEAQAGGSAFSKTLIKMEVAAATGGDALKDFGKVAGMTAKEFKTLWDNDPAAAFQSFIVGLAKLDEAGESAIATLEEIGFKEVRLRDTTLRATNATELFSRAVDDSNRAWKENTALTAEANLRYSTTKSRLTNLKNTATLFAQRIGDDLNPTIQQLIDKSNELLAAFLSMDESQRMAIIKFAAFAAAAGPAILILGKTVGAVSKVTSALGKASIGIGKFSANVKTAGGGIIGFSKTLLSSKLAAAALAAALIYGAIKLYDYASGAKAAREAMEGMKKTAGEWKNTAAETFYGDSKGLSFFGMSEDQFTRTAKDAENWLSGLLTVWSDGKKETNEIVTHWVESFKALTGSTRDELNKLNETAKEAGYTSVSAQIEKDIKKLDQMDAEIGKLLKKRQNKKLTEQDKIRLQELIDAREAIEIKYKLTPADVDGFETVRQKLEAEIARAQAKGKPDAEIVVYEAAVVAAAQGMAAINRELDAQYDKEYALIQLMEEGAEKQQALSDLNEKYNENRRAAAEEYALLLRDTITPVWNQEDIQQAGKDIDFLVQKLAEYSAATEEEKPALLIALNELTAGMDKSAVIEYLGVLTQVQSLLDSGMGLDEVQAMFPDLDFSGALQQVAAIQDFLKERKTLLPGLSEMFGTIPDELLKIATDLDMTGAQARWDEFAANPGAITTEAVIDGYSESEDAEKIRLTVDAFVSGYTEIPEGASTANLTPTGILAYVTKYAEAVTGADVSALTPDTITAMVAAYDELAAGADISALKPDDITAYIMNYLEKEGVDTSALKPEALTAFVLAYEEVTGGALTNSLTPSDIAAIVTGYLEAEGVDLSKLTPSQIEALVNTYAEAANCDKSELKAEVIARITAYEDAEGVQKTSYITAKISITGYDLTAYRQFIQDNPVNVNGVVRLSGVYEKPEDALNDDNAVFWRDGVEIPATMVPIELLTPDKVAVLAEDGTMHILLTPQVTGSPEAIEKLRHEVEQADQLGATSFSAAAGILPATLMDYVDAAIKRIETFNNEKDSFWQLWGLLEDGAKDTLDTSMKLDFSPEKLAALSAYIAEVVAAIKDGKEVSEEDLGNLKNIVDFLGGLEMTGVGENVTAGIGDAMAAAGWETEAESVAKNLENALNIALESHSPSERMKPIGEDAAAGIGAGISDYDLSADAAAMATNLESAIRTALAGDALQAIGVSAAEGLASAMILFDMTGAGSAVSRNVHNTMARNLNITTLRSVGLNAMTGLKAGIIAGRSGVVAAMREAARAAVNAAKTELKITSPSSVFRDEIGRMTMKGFGRGVLLESRAQSRVIRNAARYLTSEAKEGSIAQSTNDHRRTYNQQSSVTLTGNTFHVRDEQDIRSLAVEIAALTRRQQRGKGLRLA